MCALLGSFAACSTAQEYRKPYAETCSAQGLVPGSTEHDRCVHDLIAQQRARQELNRPELWMPRSIGVSRPLLLH